MIGLIAAAFAAGPLVDEVRVGAEAAFDARPSLIDGSTYSTAAARLSLHAEGRSGFAVSASGGLRLRHPDVPYGVSPDVWRLSVRHEGIRHRVEAGRLVRLDLRGFQRLDGVSAHVELGGPARLDAWAGRLWTPLGQGGTAVAGALATVTDRPSRSLSLGAEGRAWDGGVGVRLIAGASVGGALGQRGSALLEVQPGTGVRAELTGIRPVGRYADVGALVAWRGLTASTAPEGVSTPFDRLAKDGYGLIDLSTTLRDRGFSVEVRGGATLVTDGSFTPTPGAQAALVVMQDLGAQRLSATLRAARIGGGGLAGGAVALDVGEQALRGRLDTGVWALQTLDTLTSVVWESRAVGEVHVTGPLSLGVNAAVGTDRQLTPWLRGGIAAKVGT